MKAYRVLWRAVALLAALLAGGCATRVDEGLARIEHIVVIYAENRSFDHLYGLFPGAEGLAQASTEQKTQLDHDGRPLPHLPPVYDHGKPHPRFPQKRPNGPFQIDAAPVNGQMVQERGYLGLAHRFRMARAAEKDETLDPVHVGLFRARAVVTAPDRLVDPVEQARAAYLGSRLYAGRV